MGAACCVAAKDRTIVREPNGGTLQRHVRHSPSWSFRRDNRVAGEDTHANWLHDGDHRNDQVGVKSGTNVESAFASDEGSPLDGLGLHGSKSLVPDGTVGISKLQDADKVLSRSLVEAKESAESPSVSRSSPFNLSPSTASASTSHPTSQSQLQLPNWTPSRCHRYSRLTQYLHHASHPECKSPPFSISKEASSHLPPAWESESTRSSNDGSSDSWFIPVFSELVTSRNNRWSFDRENSGFCVDKIDRNSCRSSDSPIHLQICGVCAKLLSERSLWRWSSQRIVLSNEIAVVSILNCGHAYHAECLESVTPEINKYDPSCPVCTCGEKQSLKMSEQALKAEVNLKARKRSGNRIVDSNLKNNISLDRPKQGGAEGTASKISSSLRKSFLKRNFSFSSKSDRSLPGNQYTRSMGFFWSRSSKE